MSTDATLIEQTTTTHDDDAKVSGRSQDDSNNAVVAHQEDVLSKELASKVTVSSVSDDVHRPSHINNQNVLICDAGYGFPREKKPRKEKILAIARQLVNFLEWQQQASTSTDTLAHVRVVGCQDDEIKYLLENRTKELWDGSVLPSHVEFSCQTLEESVATAGHAVYLSPDAQASMDPAQIPPSMVIIGLLIDRRVQPNRSKNRAEGLNIVAQQWPLAQCFANMNPQEPLNVDCILEGMQQWWWNCEKNDLSKECFIQAASQAIDHHAKRHPSRPVHIAK